MAEEDEEERINKTKGGREVRGEHRRSVPLSPTSAMTRGSLTRGQDCGVAVETSLTAGQGLVAWELSSNHDTPPGTRPPAMFFVLYHVPASRAPMAMLESLLSRMHGGRTRTVLQ